MGEGAKRAVHADDKAVPVFEGRRLKDRVRGLERLLGRNIMEVEILIKALNSARAVPLILSQGYLARSVTTTRGVARSNVIERRDGERPQWGPQERPGDIEFAGAIHRVCR
jgi:hypothetical protein